MRVRAGGGWQVPATRAAARGLEKRRAAGEAPDAPPCAHRERGQGPHRRRQFSHYRQELGGANIVHGGTVERDRPSEVSDMYRVLVSETVTTPKDHGTPGRAIAWCRQQDLLGGRGEKPRRLDFTFKIFILTPGRHTRRITHTLSTFQTHTLAHTARSHTHATPVRTLTHTEPT